MTYMPVDQYFERYKEFVNGKVKIDNSNLADVDGNNDYYVRLNLAALGIAGEAGEVVDLLKKTLMHGKELDRFHLAYEMGDLLWYLTLLSNVTGISFDEMMRLNMEKLDERYGSK